MKIHKTLKKILFSVLFLIIILISVFFIYASKYYKAEDEVNDYLTSSLTVKVSEDDSKISFESILPSKTGIVFYPGAKVEEKSYAPLCYKIASYGINVYIEKMPFKMAIFGVNKANNLIKYNNSITSWYIMGHSMGGAMGGSYVKKNADKVKGLILLAAYTTSDLSNLDIKTLSIYGNCDGVLNKDKYEKYKSNLPNLKESVIDGGNHAGFGNYGKQKKDLEASISNSSQQSQTALQIALFLGFNSLISE